MSSVLDELDAVELAPDMLSVFASARSAFLLSLDVGTSGVRAALFDDNGNELSGCQISNQRNVVSFSDLGILDADALVKQVVETIDELMAAGVEATNRIRFIAISCFWHSLVGVDDSYAPVTSVLTWADTRAGQSVSFLKAQLEEREVHNRTGCRFHPSYWPPKLQWLRENQHENFQRSARWLGFSEYLRQKLFGSSSITVSMASATGLLDQRTCEWDSPLLEALKLSPSTLPEIEGDQEKSLLLPEFAERWPMLSEARLSTIVGDGAANNIGAGCCAKDRFALMIGTSGAMRVAYQGAPPDQIAPELWTYRVDRARVVVGGALSDGGGLYRWLTDLMCIGDDPFELEKQLASMEPDSHGLTILPYWLGERSTGWSASARGAILGLTQRTTPIEIVRAAMEAIAYRFNLIAGALEGVIGKATVVATGNALRSSRVWPQIIADVLGRPLVMSGVREASTRGAALLALQSLGKIHSLEQSHIDIDEIVEPDVTRHSRYKEGLERQQKMYERIVL